MIAAAWRDLEVFENTSSYNSRSHRDDESG